MILILELTGQAAPNGGTNRHSFGEDGGTIGRDQKNSWMLADPQVSAHHATITYRNGSFFIEDRSRNGVFLNSPNNRVPAGRATALNHGDQLWFHPYEMRVSIRQSEAQRFSELDDLGLHSPPLHQSFGLDRPVEPVSADVVDPLELLGGGRKPPSPKGPTVRGLDQGSPLGGHFQPPHAVADPVMPAQAPPANHAIPVGYNPLADDPFLSQPVPIVPAPAPPAPHRAPEAPPAPPPAPRPRPSPPRMEQPPRAADPSWEPAAGDLAAVLEGAGLSRADVTPELAHNFGRILRVVVSGVLDVMRSRNQIKDEFRMQATRFMPAENNPLKFSHDVDDALHNLLVKKNPAYLGPVEAFEEAFADLRNHQLAMLAGMRVAFKAMLAEFDGDRLQKDFDDRATKGLLAGKPRYWELYLERSHEIVNDPETSFRKLFGEEFARAYEEQFQQLKAQYRRAGAGSKRPPGSEG